MVGGFLVAFHKPSTFIPMKKILSGLSVALILSAGLTLSSRADVTIDFESSHGYTSGSTIVGVDDSSVPGTTKWTNLLTTTASDMVVSAGTGVGGSQSLRITDNYSASSGAAYGTSLDLSGSSSIFASAFKVSFSLAVTNMGGTGNVAQVYLGFNGTAAGSQRYWMNLLMGTDGALNLVTDSVSGNSVANFSLGNYSAYAVAGEYVTFDLTIDPTTKTYTNVAVSGSLNSINFTSTLSASSYNHNGEIPYLSGNTGLPALAYNLDLVAGGMSTGTVNFDNISISNVPEPATFGLLAMAMGVLAVSRGAKRRTTTLG